MSVVRRPVSGAVVSQQIPEKYNAIRTRPIGPNRAFPVLCDGRRTTDHGREKMAANLTPQYLQAEAEYKKAQTAEERLDCLKRMFSLLPKHKASEKLQAELKKKISATREEADRERKSPKKAGVSHKIPRQGAGQVVIVGGPNAGKSKILTRLTRATPEGAPYPFTTREPHAGMMEWEDVRVQLVDPPPITADYL